MLIPDWLIPTFALMPAMLWYCFGVGLPWALAILPRSDWRHLPTVTGVSLALGPMGCSTIMFLIGTFSKLDGSIILILTCVAALIGWAIALRRRNEPVPQQDRRAAPIAPIDAILFLSVAVAVLLRFWNTAYWPFATYDEFWVYGYNTRIFMLDRAIPASMGYYPQLIPLSYTFGQLMWGQINDHAARVILPYIGLGSILMTYLLGARLFNRRIGLLAAAIWALYPHHGVWSQFGDLEVPITFYFTATAAFFTLGWSKREWRYVILGGLMMGTALWTKPTAAALVQSVALIGVVAVIPLLRAKRDPIAFIRGAIQTPLARYAMIALLVAAPVGGMWYIRNILFGHPPIVMPEGYWQDTAQRSGQELGWPLLVAGTVTLWLVLTRKPRAWIGLIGFALMAVVSLLSAFGGQLPTVSELAALMVGQIVARIQPTRLTILDYALLSIGGGLLIWAFWPVWRRLESIHQGIALSLLAFVLPYFITWFWSYSYHFRLSFAIVPILCLGVGIGLDALGRIFATRYGRSAAIRIAVSTLVIIMAFPGWWAVLSGLAPVIAQTLLDDDAKYAYGNPALMTLVAFLRQESARLGRPMRIIAPNELRLNFFFPHDDIRGNVYPTTLDQVADIDFFIDSSAGERLYITRGIYYNQLLASRTRENAMRRVFTTDDGNFRFSVYTIHNQDRYIEPKPNGPIGVQVGDFAYLYGYDLSTLRQYPGENIYLTLWWKALKPSDIDYSVFIHFWDAEKQQLGDSLGGQPGEGVFSIWQGVQGAQINYAYHTRLWQPGEVIKDEWKFPVKVDLPPGRYELRIGMFDPLSNKRLPIIKDGQTIGDSVLLNRLEIVKR